MAALAALIPFVTMVAPVFAPILAAQSQSGIMTQISQAMQYAGQITNEIKRRVDQAYQMYKTMYLIITLLLIGKCFFLFGDLIVKLFRWAFSFIGWFFPHFIPWFLQFVTCTISKITHLPQCFLWYGLDTAGWIFYLPFRFLFWLLDELLFSGRSTIVKAEHDAWEYMYKFDNYIYYGLNTGVHIFHFPDSVNNTCFKCKIKNLKAAPTFPFKAIEKFIKCILTPF